jgi:hypothetical protein
VQLSPLAHSAPIAQANDALRTLHTTPMPAEDGTAAPGDEEARRSARSSESARSLQRCAVSRSRAAPPRRQAAAAATAALVAVTALAGALTAGAECASAPAELSQTVALLHDAVLLTPVAPMHLQARD